MMELVFVSFSHRDRERAQVLVDLIKESGKQVFWSPDPVHGLEPGSPWFEDLAARLRQTTHLVLLATPNSVGEAWPLFEAGFAFANKAAVTPLVVGMGVDDLVGPLKQFQGFSIEGPITDVAARLARALGVETIDHGRLEKLRSAMPQNSGSSLVRKAILGMRNGAPDWQLLVDEYLDSLQETIRGITAAERGNTRASLQERHAAARTLVSEVSEFFEVVLVLRQPSEISGIAQSLASILVGCSATTRSDLERGLRDGDKDLSRLLCREFFLVVVAQMLKRGRFAELAALLGTKFPVEHRLQRIEVGFEFLGTIPDRWIVTAREQEMNFYFLHFKWLEARGPVAKMSLSDLAEADLLLSMRCSAEANEIGGGWLPITGMPAFDRGESLARLQSVQTPLGQRNLAHLLGLSEASFAVEWVRRWNRIADGFYRSYPFARSAASEFPRPRA